MRRKVPRIIDFFKRIPGVRTEKQANVVAFITSLIFFALSIIIYRGNPGKVKLTYLEDLPPEAQRALPPEILKHIPSRKNTH